MKKRTEIWYNMGPLKIKPNCRFMKEVILALLPPQLSACASFFIIIIISLQGADSRGPDCAAQIQRY